MQDNHKEEKAFLYVYWNTIKMPCDISSVLSHSTIILKFRQSLQRHIIFHNFTQMGANYPCLPSVSVGEGLVARCSTSTNSSYKYHKKGWGVLRTFKIISWILLVELHWTSLNILFKYKFLLSSFENQTVFLNISLKCLRISKTLVIIKTRFWPLHTWQHLRYFCTLSVEETNI